VILCYNKDVINNKHMKKINNYHLSLLLIIVFILNTILFQSIKITQGQQFKQPTLGPGAGTGASIVTSPLSASLDLGGHNIFGAGNININGSGYFSGDVGIGTDDPSHELQIASGTFHIGGAGSAGYVEATSLGVVNLRAVDAGGASVLKSDADAKLYLLSGNLKGIIIHESGRVGIGTTNSNALLHIEGDETTLQLSENQDTGGIANIDFANENNVRARIHSNLGNQNLHFYTGTDMTDEKMVIKADGSVGLGVSSPNKNLHIYDDTGNAEINLQSVAGENNHWGIYHDSSLDDNGNPNNSLKFWKKKSTYEIEGENLGGKVIDENRFTIHPSGSVSITGGNLSIGTQPYGQDYDGDGVFDGEGAEFWMFDWAHSAEVPAFWNIHAGVNSLQIRRNNFTQIYIDNDDGEMHTKDISSSGVISSGSSMDVHGGNLHIYPQEYNFDFDGDGVDDGEGGELFLFRWRNDGSEGGAWSIAGAENTINFYHPESGRIHGFSIGAGGAEMGDINLSNEKSETPNEVDGTRGSWTIQEGDENLFVINRNTGKKYKILLGEVE